MLFAAQVFWSSAHSFALLLCQDLEFCCNWATSVSFCWWLPQMRNHILRDFAITSIWTINRIYHFQSILVSHSEVIRFWAKHLKCSKSLYCHWSGMISPDLPPPSRILLSLTDSTPRSWRTLQDTGFKSEAVVIMILFIMALLRIHKFAIITIINRFDRNFGEKCSNSFKHDNINHDNEIVLMFIMIIIRFDVWLKLLILLANSQPKSLFFSIILNVMLVLIMCVMIVMVIY